MESKIREYHKNLSIAQGRIKNFGNELRMPVTSLPEIKTKPNFIEGNISSHHTNVLETEIESLKRSLKLKDIEIHNLQRRVDENAKENQVLSSRLNSNINSMNSTKRTGRSTRIVTSNPLSTKMKFRSPNKSNTNISLASLYNIRKIEFGKKPLDGIKFSHKIRFESDVIDFKLHVLKFYHNGLFSTGITCIYRSLEWEKDMVNEDSNHFKESQKKSKEFNSFGFNMFTPTQIKVWFGTQGCISAIKFTNDESEISLGIIDKNYEELDPPIIKNLNQESICNVYGSFSRVFGENKKQLGMALTHLGFELIKVND